MVARQPARRTTVPAKPLRNVRLLLVEARFYEDLSDALADGAMTALQAAGASFDRITVPGALEIPAAIRFASQAKGKQRYHGFVALGCVIRGETTHYEIVSMESSRALQHLAIDYRLAIGNGILTVENEAQAWARARRSEQDKGGGAARAALALVELRRRFGVSA